MSRLRQADILIELLELSEEVMADIRQQLLYYRASVYKDETASTIGKKIDQLRIIAAVVNDDHMNEPLRDYDAMDAHKALQIAPGECSFSTRVTSLLRALGVQMEILRATLAQMHGATGRDELARSILKHRHELLAICRHGSRPWSLIQNL